MGNYVWTYGSKDSLGHKNNFFSKYGYQTESDFKYPRYGTKINGISISIGGVTDSYNSGLIVNGLSGTSYVTNGIQISGVLNLQYAFNGILIAGLSNKTTIGNGIQIALINSCQSGRLLQIDLFNRIGKRVLPFVNMNFRK